MCSIDNRFTDSSKGEDLGIYSPAFPLAGFLFLSLPSLCFAVYVGLFLINLQSIPNFALSPFFLPHSSLTSRHVV